MVQSLAEIRMFAGNFAPRGWALCQGQLLPISANQALFSLLGTTYGGDGRTTFALPDLRGRMVIGPGTGPGLPTYRQGAKAGTETNTLNATQIPYHTHFAQFTNNIATLNVGSNHDGGDDPSDQWMGITANNDLLYDATAAVGESMGAVVGDLSATVSNTGAATPINNMQPYLSVNFIIALTGTFPSRS